MTALKINLALPIFKKFHPPPLSKLLLYKLWPFKQKYPPATVFQSHTVWL